MSAEKNLRFKVNNLSSLEIPQKSDNKISGRVDINVLLNRARKVREKEAMTSLVFVGLPLSLIFVVGLILSF
jgi:hypothetical protein